MFRIQRGTTEHYEDASVFVCLISLSVTAIIALKRRHGEISEMGYFWKKINIFNIKKYWTNFNTNTKNHTHT